MVTQTAVAPTKIINIDIHVGARAKTAGTPHASHRPHAPQHAVVHNHYAAAALGVGCETLCELGAATGAHAVIVGNTRYVLSFCLALLALITGLLLAVLTGNTRNVLALCLALETLGTRLLQRPRGPLVVIAPAHTHTFSGVRETSA